MLPLDLIKTAKRLVGARMSRRPRQADLKRAISTAYYAVFRAMCRNCADSVVGTSGSARSQPAWLQAYRSIEHRFAKSQCSHMSVIGRFPRSIEDFAHAFVELQVKRHAADYDPGSRFTLSNAIKAVETAERAIKLLGTVPLKDRRAFAVWVAMKSRPD